MPLISTMDKWIEIEKQVENTLKEISPKGDKTILSGLSMWVLLVWQGV